MLQRQDTILIVLVQYFSLKLLIISAGCANGKERVKCASSLTPIFYMLFAEQKTVYAKEKNHKFFCHLLVINMDIDV